jgi:hypothetical protein
MCQTFVVMKRLDFPIVSVACQSEKERRFVNIVETLDQKVGLNCVNGVFGTD